MSKVLMYPIGFAKNPSGIFLNYSLGRCKANVMSLATTLSHTQTHAYTQVKDRKFLQLSCL